MAKEGSLHILVVDDEEIIRYVFRTYLSKAGYRIDEACDGIEALEALKATTYDFAVVDYRMPRMDGMELLAEMRDLYPDLPVVIMTGHGADDVLNEARELGAVGGLNKPFRLKELDSLMAEHLH